LTFGWVNLGTAWHVSNLPKAQSASFFIFRGRPLCFEKAAFPPADEVPAAPYGNSVARMII